MTRLLQSGLLMLVLAVVLYGAMALYADGDLVWLAIKSLDYRIWIAILALSLGNYLLRYWRWSWYILHNSEHKISHMQHAAIYIAGFSLTTTPGKAGEAMRSLYLSRYGIGHARSLGALLVERIMDLFAILMMAGVGFFVLLDNNPAVQITVVVAFVIMLLTIVVVKMPRDKIMALRLVQKLPSKLRQFVFFASTTLDNARDLLSLRFLIVGLLIGLISWGLEGYGLLLVMQAYSPELSTIYLAVAVYGLAILLGTISMSPAGIGASEFIMASLLVLAKFDMPSAIAITYICRIATLWFAVGLGLLCMVVLSAVGIKPQFPKDV